MVSRRTWQKNMCANWLTNYTLPLSLRTYCFTSCPGSRCSPICRRLRGHMAPVIPKNIRTRIQLLSPDPTKIFKKKSGITWIRRYLRTEQAVNHTGIIDTGLTVQVHVRGERLFIYYIYRI